MRAVIQRVRRAGITIHEEEQKEMAFGVVVLLGIEQDDQEEDIEWLAGKIMRLRIFDDNDGKMNLSLLQTGGEIMIVSQFTLHASTKKGNRPSWIRAADPGFAEPMYDRFVLKVASSSENRVITGKFGAMMEVEIINDGPVTIFMDTKRKE